MSCVRGVTPQDQHPGHQRGGDATPTLYRVSDFPANVVMLPSRQATKGLDHVPVHARDPRSGFPVPACLALHHVPRDEYMRTPEDVTCPDCLDGRVIGRPLA